MDKTMQMKSGNSYRKFFLMLGLSFVAMYVTMYLNTYAMDHVYFSMTRFYMVCLGISVMGVIMLLVMKAMYTNKKKNTGILIGCVLLFSVALTLVRVQAPIVGDVLYMKGMIPHHSIAILTSERAAIKDPEVRKLADGIIAAQKKEIEQMKNMIKRLENDK
jgi:FlaA1/EpsC-like NDP-sugar epimerase